MRVLFLTLYPDSAASPRYRVGQFIPRLREMGVDCAIAPAITEEQHARLTGTARQSRAFWYHAAETPRRVRQILGARGYDVVFLQKAVMSAYVRGLPGLLRSRARKIVFDLDDAVHLAPPHPLRGPWRLLQDANQGCLNIQLADLVLAGNRWLFSEAIRLNAKNAAHFPTVVDTDRFVPPKEPPRTFRIGWIGGPSTTPHLGAIGADLSAMEEVSVALVGADPAKVPWPGAEVMPWSLDTEVETLQSFSVGVMPLPRDAWSQGKCGLKALQYMACGVPCVATPYGAAREIIKDGVNGIFADSPQAWQDALQRMRDPKYRNPLGEAARATVVEKFALRTAAPRLRDLLESIV